MHLELHEGYTKAYGSAPHFRSKHGVSLINPLSSTFDSTKGDSSSYITTLSVLESGEHTTNSYAAARSLDRQGIMRGNTTKTVNTIDATRLLPQTVSRSHGNALSQRVPASIRITPAGTSHPGLQTSPGDYQIPQSEIVREHLRSGHVSSHTAAGTAAAAHVAAQRHPVKVSLQLPSLQGTAITPVVVTQFGSPQHLSKQAFPGLQWIGRYALVWLFIRRRRRTTFGNRKVKRRSLPSYIYHRPRSLR